MRTIESCTLAERLEIAADTKSTITAMLESVPKKSFTCGNYITMNKYLSDKIKEIDNDPSVALAIEFIPIETRLASANIEVIEEAPLD